MLTSEGIYQLVDLSLDDPIALLQYQARLHCRFITLNSQDKALEATNVAGSDLLQPRIELLACACAGTAGTFDSADDIHLAEL